MDIYIERGISYFTCPGDDNTRVTLTVTFVLFLQHSTSNDQSTRVTAPYSWQRFSKFY